jgi:hypothetical protein
MISQKLNPAFFLEYLAILTGPSISILITYIVFVTKLQKKANPFIGGVLIYKIYRKII